MAFDFDVRSTTDLQHSMSRKWGAYPGELSMWVAEMDFGIAPAIASSLRQWATNVAIGYPPDELHNQAAQAAASWYSDRFSVDLPAQELINVPNVLSVFDLALTQLVDPGTPIIVPTPAYMPFLTLPQKFGHPITEVPCIDDGGVSRLDLDKIDAAFAGGAQMLILVNPSNPTGRVYTREELSDLALVVEQNHGRIFVDEIHAPLTLDANFTPYASISDAAKAHSITVFGPTKGWNMPGLKVAHVRTTHPGDLQRMEPAMSMLNELVPTPGLTAAHAAYTDGREWNTAVNDYLVNIRNYCEAAIADIPGIRIQHSEATYISWLDFRGLRQAGVIPHGLSPAQWLHTCGLALTPGELLGTGYEDYARMIIASPQAVVEQALEVLRKAASGSHM